MISPVLRCHHRSGSLKRDRVVRTVSTANRIAITTGNEKSARHTRRPPISGPTSICGSADASSSVGVFDILWQSDEAVQVSARDVEAPRSHRFIPLAVFNCLSSEFYLIVSQKPLEGSQL